MSDRSARRFGLLVVLLGALPFGASFISQEGFSALALWLTGRLNDAFFELLPLLQFRLRVLGLVLAVLGGLLWWQAGTWGAWVEEAVYPFWRSAGSFLRKPLRPADGTVRVTVLLLVGIGLLVRWHFLFDPIEFDESDSIMSYGARPIVIGLSSYTQPNNHIFHTIWLHLAWLLFGTWEWAIRLPALVAGLVLIPVSYALGKQFYDRPTGLLAAALITGSPWMVLYSVEGRGYTILCVLACVVWLCSRSLLRQDQWPVWLGWALAIALGMYTIPTFLYVAAGVALWLVLGVWSRPAAARNPFLVRFVIATGLAIGMTLLFYLPVLLVLGPGPLVANPYVKPRTLAYVLERAPLSLRELIQFWTGDYPGPVAAVLAVALAFGLVRRYRGNGYALPPFLAAIVMGLLMALAQRVVPYTRVWTYWTPLAAVTVAAGLVWLLRLSKGSLRLSAALALLVATSLSAFVWVGRVVPARSTYPGIENIAVWLQANLKPGDVVTAERTAGAPLTYYLRRHGYSGTVKLAPCDPVTTFYSNPDVAPSGRAYAVVAEGRQSPEKVLSIACLGPSANVAPVVRYHRPGLKIIEFPATEKLAVRPEASSLVE
jgi:hypothetical protein